MAKQINPQSKPSRRRQPQHVAGTPTKHFACLVDDCTKIYSNATDVSRHKWTHLPKHLLPPCASGDVHCPTKYCGRSEKMKIHMDRKHHASVPSDYQWPTLAQILTINGITLFEREATVLSPILSPASTSQSLRSPPVHGNASSQPLNSGSFDGTEQFMQWPGSNYALASHANALAQVGPQDYFQPQSPTPSPSSSRSPSADPDDFFYSSMEQSVPYSSVDGPHGLPFPGSFESQFLNEQVEDMDFSMLLNSSQPSEPFEAWDWAAFVDEHSL